MRKGAILRYYRFMWNAASQKHALAADTRILCSSRFPWELYKLKRNYFFNGSLELMTCPPSNGRILGQ
jgi:hypothetical protein